MKKIVISSVAFLILSSFAYAVSLDFKVYPAISIGDVKTSTSDDGLTTETTIEFSGQGLRPFMALLPPAKDGEKGGKVLKAVRMLQITNAGQPGVTGDKTTSIYIDCKKDKQKVPTCHVTVEKGSQPG